MLARNQVDVHVNGENGESASAAQSREQQYVTERENALKAAWRRVSVSATLLEGDQGAAVAGGRRPAHERQHTDEGGDGPRAHHTHAYSTRALSLLTREASLILNIFNCILVQLVIKVR